MAHRIRFLVLFLTLFALPFTGLAADASVTAEKPLRPFLEIEDGDVTLAEQLKKFEVLDKSDPAAAKHFGTETVKNLGNADEVKAFVGNMKSGNYENILKVEKYSSSKTKLVTAGIFKNNPEKIKYHREVRKDEQVVYAKIGEIWKPWFLLHCGNPVRVQEADKKNEVAKAPPKPTSPPPAPPVVELEKKTEQPAPPSQTVVGAPAPPAKKEKKCRKVIAPSQDIVTHSDTYIHSVIHRRICE